jgi:hypothetical protein
MSPRVIVFAVTPGVLAPAVVVITNDAMTSEPANTAAAIDFVRTMDPPFSLPTLVKAPCVGTCLNLSSLLQHRMSARLGERIHGYLICTL